MQAFCRTWQSGEYKVMFLHLWRIVSSRNSVAHKLSLKFCPQPDISNLKFSSVFCSHLILHLQVCLSAISSASLLQGKFDHQLRVPSCNEHVLCSVLGQDINYTSWGVSQFSSVPEGNIEILFSNRPRKLIYMSSSAHHKIT